MLCFTIQPQYTEQILCVVCGQTTFHECRQIKYWKMMQGTHTLYNEDKYLPAVVVVGLFSALIVHTSDDDDEHHYLQ